MYVVIVTRIVKNNVFFVDYYRVNYDLRNWDLLSKALILNHKEIDLHNRAQIIDDAFSLASMGLIPYRIPLKISQYFYKEMEYAPLKVMKDVYDSLKIKLTDTSTLKNFEVSRSLDHFQII